MRSKEDGTYELKEVTPGNTEVIINAQQIEPYDGNEGAQPGTRASPLTKKYGNNWNKKDVKASYKASLSCSGVLDTNLLKTRSHK